MNKIPHTKVIRLKKLFAKVDALDDKILSCPRIKLSNSQNLIMDGVETGVYCQSLLNNFVVKTRTSQIFTLLYLTMIVYLQLLFWKKMPNAKTAQGESLSKSELQNRQRQYR